ncbi:hypothetical protein [Hyalangium versicolor]|uniref:hypothetical protein n=1 Tax=Hyalangium versicolor TaxID=2861190 RepID=UPI001CCC98F6|nr:hypothetical protein [Hyalangium versicolor]
MSAWAGIAWLWLHMAAICLLTGLGMVSLLWALGVRPTVVKFHQGPSLFSFRLLGMRWSFGPLPSGNSVSFTPDGAPEETEENPFLRLSFPRRLLAISAGVLGMLLIAVVCLSPARALQSCLSGFEQLVNVPRAAERVEAFLSLRPLGFRTSLGVMAAKLVALNLLPLPPLAGYMLLREVVGKLRGQRPQGMPPLPVWGFVIYMVLWTGWVWGAYKGLRLHEARTVATARQ